MISTSYNLFGYGLFSCYYFVFDFLQSYVLLLIKNVEFPEIDKKISMTPSSFSFSD